MATNYPTLTYLTSDPKFDDYRPTMNPAGDTVIFERTPVPDDGSPTTLQIIDDLNNPNPVPFLSGSPPPSQTRPDWCWVKGNSNVLFNGGASNSDSSPVSVWLAGNDGSNPTLIPGTTGAYYPKWNLGGTAFVTENTGSAASPVPCNSIFSIPGMVLANNVNGKIASGSIPTYGGMPAVMSSDLPQIAYAGEPMIDNWNGPNSGLRYNENNNYIFLNKWTQNGFIAMPMEWGASVTSFDQNFEGRAPDVSPDGTMIVFESNRPNGGKKYSIYLFSQKNYSVTQVTEPGLNCQHAKFFPCGTKLILGAQNPTWKIAWVDISSLLA